MTSLHGRGRNTEAILHTSLGTCGHHTERRANLLSHKPWRKCIPWNSRRLNSNDLVHADEGTLMGRLGGRDWLARRRLVRCSTLGFATVSAGDDAERGGH